jgi:trigger factor
MTNIQVEDLTDVKKKVVFEIPADRVQEMMDSQYRDLKKTVQLKGFRKGKVPLDLIRSFFKKQVKADTARKMIDETFQSGLQEKRITAVAVLDIDSPDVEDGKDFIYSAEIEVPPQIDVQGYEDLKLTKTIRTVNDEDVDQRVERLREQLSKLSPVEGSRPVKEGDQLLVDIQAKADDKEIASLTVSDYHLEMGRNFYLEDFDKNLDGMKAGETKEVTVDLPDSFPTPDLAGKPADLTVTIKEAKERVLPELDDDFAKDLGEYENLDQLKDEIRKDIGRMHESETNKELENQIIDALIEKNEFEVPATMVENQIDAFLNQTLRSLAAQGIDPDRLPPPTQEQREHIRPSATRTVKAGLLFDSIAKQEEFEVSEEELTTGVSERAESMGVSADYLRDQLEANNMLEDLRSNLLQEKVIKLIEEKAVITEKEPSDSEEESAETQTEKE